ncbi:hypothetical protein H5410_036163, partial [Solanum commersonii]
MSSQISITQMESEPSHIHQRRRKHTTRAPLSSSSVQDSNFESSVMLGELITKILSRLQLGLIYSLEFVKIHLRRSANEKTCHRLMLKFDSPKNNLKDCSVNSIFYDHVIRTIDVDYLPKISYETIKKLKKLPSFGIDCFYMYGFVYDELHDDYEVVVITRTVGDDNSRYNVGQIYSLNSRLVNGKLHWAITNLVSINYKYWVILVVDLVDGRWKKIENPCYGEGTFYSIMYLGVVDVWVMKEYRVKESWTKIFNSSDRGTFLFKNISFFMIYNPHDDSKRFPRKSNYHHLQEAQLYIESLPPIYSKRGENTLAVLHFLLLQFKIQTFKSIFPENLINEILLTLSVKSLVQFRCVLKSWFVSISSPEFIKSHLSIYANNK